jgi:sodium transport system ATP-binding protein
MRSLSLLRIALVLVVSATACGRNSLLEPSDQQGEGGTSQGGSGGGGNGGSGGSGSGSRSDSGAHGCGTGIVIEFDRLTKRYGDFLAVDELTLTVQPGVVYALLGANGAGKTTALRCLATLLRPSGGTCRVDGHDVRAAPLRARAAFGFLSASMGLYQRLSARELLEYFGRLQGMRGEALRARVDELIVLFEIEAFERRLCGTLSTGQRQRVAIARTVLHDPPALILDEPTLGLDILSGRTIFAFIHTARMRQRAVLFSTHQMDEVELLADRVGVLAGGRLVAEGTVDELVEASGQKTLARAFLRILEAHA